MTSTDDALLGGYVNPETGEYELGGPLSTAPLYVPASIALDGEQLVWKSGRGHFAQPTDELLWRFIHLVDAPPARVAAFAQKWGVLRLCGRHHLPATHDLRAYRLRGDRFRKNTCGLQPFGKGYCEAVEDWHAIARWARAILRVDSADRLRQDPRAEDLGTLKNAPARFVFHFGGDRTWARDSVNAWLDVAHCRPTLTHILVPATPQHRRPVPRLSGGLFGALGLQLAAAVSGIPRHAFCSNCGLDYVPAKKAPTPGRRNYCRRPSCGRRANWRHNKRQDRARP